MQDPVSTTAARPPTEKTALNREAGVPEQPINPLTLATLDFGLFLSLRKLGTERERICAALGLTAADFDYISALAR